MRAIFVLIKCEMGRAYQVAQAAADEIAQLSELYSYPVNTTCSASSTWSRRTISAASSPSACKHCRAFEILIPCLPSMPLPPAAVRGYRPDRSCLTQRHQTLWFLLDRSILNCLSLFLYRITCDPCFTGNAGGGICLKSGRRQPCLPHWPGWGFWD